MPRGRPRQDPAQPSSPTPDEAKARGLWAIYRVRRGYYIAAPPGQVLTHKFRTWAKDEVAARNACLELGRDELHGSHSSGPRVLRQPFPRKGRGRPRESSKNFPCGHPRTPDNTYATTRGTRCRTCGRMRALSWYFANRDRSRRSKNAWNRTPKARKRFERARLAYLIYWQLRMLVKRDGCWEDTKSEGGA